ncbi:adhesion G-protein coupled receptor G6-like [Octopus vulgaris]|uniref:Adhesion G-protein coupled receptor G6-like n=1 Tax=Octopus vulgaris TaxID=6645 RepID=A0AA36MIM2_OCTVU|nr:adhesion G-protein coupled receptor G6-like [Octopus vulgaris]
MKFSYLKFSAPQYSQYKYLDRNQITTIPQGSFQNIPSLTLLKLQNNQIQKYEDGAFLFLPSIKTIDLRNNKNMTCGCHLPAFVNHIKNVYNRSVTVKGECQDATGATIPILNYAQCKDYSLFQRNLQCQTCSKMTCNESSVTSCPGAEPVCRFAMSMNGVTMKIEKSCSTYRKCVEAMRNNTLTCNKWTNGTSCTGCCVGNLCNKNDFLDWTNFFVFHLTFKKFSEYKISAENLSKAMERELTTTGTFTIEYCGNRTIFAIYSKPYSKTSKKQLLRNISQVLNTSQTLRNVGVQQSYIDRFDEMVCDESTTSNNNQTFSWPMTKIGTTAEIPCHAYLATRYCSPRDSEMASSQYMTAAKCSPFTGIWKEPDMSQCNNTDWITQRLKDIVISIDTANFDNISEEMLNISKKSIYFKEVDVDLAVGIHEKMVSLIPKVSANNTLRSINNLINIPEEVLAGAEQENRSDNRLLHLIQEIPEKIPLEEQQVTAIYSNLGIGVAKVKNDTFDGLFYGVSYGTNETEPKTWVPKVLMITLLLTVTQNAGTKQNVRINSHVLASNIPNLSVSDLDEPVNISFNILDQNVYQAEKETDNALSIISKTGCGISFVCLVLTIIIHVCFRKLWDLMSSKVLISLCSSLAVTYFIFLVGMQSYVQTMAGCKAVAVLLHYFLLTSLAWMSVEAFHVFLSVVVVFKRYQTSFMKKSSILAWGLPAVIVIITLAINSTNNYIKIAEVCWLNKPSFFAAFLTPVVMVLIFNFIIFLL